MTTAIVLAAGGATRFGSPKQIAELDGVALVRRAIQTVRVALSSRIVCVVGAHRELVVPVIADLDVDVVDNPDWRLGLSTSISSGVNAAIDLGETEAIAVLLADQPFIPPSHLRTLHAQVAEGAAVAATRYDRGAGVPAVFGASLLSSLQTLTGDRGAATLIRRTANSVSLPLPSSALLDVDSPTDLQAAHARPRSGDQS